MGGILITSEKGIVEPTVELSVTESFIEEIDAFTVRVQSSHPLMRAAQRGELRQSVVLQYLVDIRYLLRHSVPHLELAQVGAKARGQLALAAHFERKRSEEIGHDLWADHDVLELQRMLRADPPGVSASMVDLVHYIESVVRAEPAHYLAYVFFAELFIVRAGEAWVTALEENCGIPREAMTAIIRHVELDQHHVAQSCREVDALVGPIADLRSIMDVLRESITYFGAFLDSLFECEQRHRFVG